jgi:predicted ATPase/transcriptional regulator with XRE-family HTH domain
MDTPITFGDWLQQRRKALGLTREQLAQRVGYSVSGLRKIESGERRPSLQIAELLANGLGVAAEERLLFLKVARGEMSLERLQSPQPAVAWPGHKRLTSPPAPRLNLPTYATPLVGRQAELAEVGRLLQEPECRLLTLVGPGGIGKTRLAIGAARQIGEILPGGACFVPLASLTSSAFIIPTIANALGFAFQGPADPKTQLYRHLWDKQMLLVLDNVEHLLGEGLAELPVELLQYAPAVKLLITSREVLGLQAEWVFEVRGLPTPPGVEAEEEGEGSAVELFLQRAQRAHVGFNPTADDYAAIVRLCQLVEGMPLAIELAAAWMRLLTCPEITSEIEHGLDFLAGPMRDAPPRQRSLRAAFDHSWNLLADAERRLLCRLAIFHGGFERKAAEQIAGASLPLLSALVNKSLLRRVGEGRYDLHGMIRQYALLHLAAECDLERETRDLHSHYYLALLSDRDEILRSGAQPQILRELVRDIDNLRSAWAWAAERQMVEALAHAVRTLGCLFELGGWLGEGIALLEQAVRRGPTGASDQQAWRRVSGEALGQQALLLFRRGDFQQAAARLVESLDLLRPLADPHLLSPPLLFYGVITMLDGNFAQGQTVLEEALACARAAQARWYEAYAIHSLGYIASQQGRYQEGCQRMYEGLALWRAIGDPRYIAVALNFLSPTLIQLGHYSQAESSLQESLDLCIQTGDRWGMGTASRFLGLLALVQGDIATARICLHKSLQTFAGFSIGWDVVRTLIYLGEADHAAGDLAEAHLTLQDALAQARSAHAIPLALDALVALAALHLDCDAPRAALRLAAFVSGHPAATHAARTRADHLFDTAKAQVTPDEVSAACEWAGQSSIETIDSMV